MGSVDTGFATALQRRLALWQAVETGTFRGVTARKLARIFPHVVTIELSPDLHAEAVQRLADQANITALQGHSADRLTELPPADSGTLYFLDGHWSAGPTDGAGDQCPVLAELAAIGAGHPNDVVIIDDARLFASAPPPPNDPAQWPSLIDVLDKLREHHPEHIVTVINDQILAVPQGGREALDQYGWRVQHTAWPIAKAHAIVETVRVRTGV